jgi:hypothetical protein
MPPHADVLQLEHLPFPKSLRDFQRLFKDDAACARYLEGAKWPKGFVCPHCDEKGEPFRLATRTSVLTCRACRKQTSLTVDTVMQRTHTPLAVWFWAAYLVSSMTPGMSAVQFQRQLGLSRYETAFQILRQIRMMPVMGKDGWSIFRNILIGELPVKPGPKPKSVAKRLDRFVNFNGPIPSHRPELGPCHIWVGAIRADGYGAITVAGKTEQAHRVAFKLAEGRWPDPCALHHCDTRACVRRSHLFEGTKSENTDDMVSKRRSTPRALTATQVATVLRRKAKGETQVAIARSLNVSEALISLTLKRAAQ